MATYQLTLDQTMSFERGGFAEIRVLEEAIEWAERIQPGEPVVVKTCDGHVAFALTSNGSTYEIN